MNTFKTCFALACTMLSLNSYGQTVTNDSLKHTLGTVTVAASKPVIEHKADRIVFNVANSVSAVGSDAYELLTRTPGIQVNNGNIQIPGKGTVRIMVNDKLVQLSGDELEALLRSMPSERISKIEVITTPPANYDAAGNAGIINIITRKTTRRGWNGNIGGSYFQRLRPGAMISGGLNYRSPKWAVYTTAMTSKNDYTALMNNTTYYTQQLQQEQLNQRNHARFSSIELGADYHITPSATIGIVAAYRHRTRAVTQSYRTDVLRLSDAREDSILYTLANEPFTGSNLNASIDYDWKIDTGGRRLRISMNYFHSSNYIERAFITNHTTAGGLPTGYETYNQTAGDHSVGIKAITADWDVPQRWADLSIGAKASFITNSTGYFINTYEADRFTYSEHTQAVYVSSTKTWGKWQAKLGLRAECTQTSGISSVANPDFSNSYCRLFPTGYLQYEPTKSLTLHLNYSRRIERPDYDMLNPFKDYNTDVSYYTGNPFLQPYTSDNAELGGMIKSSYNFRLYVTHKKNFFTNVSVVDNDHQTYYVTTANTGNCWSYGIFLSRTFPIGKAWEIVPQFNGYYVNISSAYYNEAYRTGKPAFNAEVNNVITLNKGRTLIAELGARYQSAEQKEVVLQYAYSVIRGGVKAMLFDKQLTAAINFNDPFNTDIRRFENRYNRIYSTSYFDRRSLNISLSWKFGNKDIKKTDKGEGISGETSRAE